MSDPPGNERQSGPDSVAGLRARLERSRAALLETLSTLTESDFASEIEAGRSVLDLLAELAPAELAAATDAGEEAAARSRRDAMLAPQMVHDLAGARRRTLLALDAIEEGGSAESEAPPELRAVAEREEQAAAAIRARFGGSSEDA
ncbi:MAG: hypothetical protein F4Z25_11625 [Chloroflexi bacterium]|nr:hypothetical protein [Chloroflexota bacterium]